MSNTPKILVVGSLVMDVIVSSERFVESGESIIGLDFKTAAGGKGANQAVQAARLGADVTMIGKVGNDDFGCQLIKSVEDSGVDVSNIMVSNEKPTAVGNVQLEVQGDKTSNRIVVVPGANMTLTIDDIAFLKETISEYDMVMLQLEIPMEVNMAVAKYARDKGVPVMLNPAPYQPLPDEFLSCLTYISPNEHEAADMTGMPIKDSHAIQLAISSLLDKGVENVIITLGSKGAAFGNKSGIFTSPSVNYGPVLDPTAAGDSFVGAFCTAVCLGAPIKDAISFANHTAGITVTKFGAQPSLPTKDMVLEFMKKTGCDISSF